MSYKHSATTSGKAEPAKIWKVNQRRDSKWRFKPCDLYLYRERVVSTFLLYLATIDYFFGAFYPPIG